MGQKALAVDKQVAGQPDDEAGRCSYADSAGQDEQSSVENRAYDDFTELRTPVRRQLQREGGRMPFKIVLDRSRDDSSVARTPRRIKPVRTAAVTKDARNPPLFAPIPIKTE